MPPGDVRRKLNDVLKPEERRCWEVVKTLPRSLAEARARRSTVPSPEVEFVAVAELLSLSPVVVLKFGSTIGCAADSGKSAKAKAKARNLETAWVGITRNGGCK